MRHMYLPSIIGPTPHCWHLSAPAIANWPAVQLMMPDLSVLVAVPGRASVQISDLAAAQYPTSQALHCPRPGRRKLAGRALNEA